MNVWEKKSEISCLLDVRMLITITATVPATALPPLHRQFLTAQSTTWIIEIEIVAFFLHI